MLGVRKLQLKVEQEENCRIDGQEEKCSQVRRVPLPGGKAHDLLPSAGKRGNPEKDPREANDVKEDDSAAPARAEGGRRYEFTLAGEQALDGKASAVNAAPNNESPVRSVP